MPNAKNIRRKFVCLLVCLHCLIFPLAAQQENGVFNLTADALEGEKTADLSKLFWKYQSGDNINWANPQFDDSAWELIEGTRVNPKSPPQSGWNGRAWFRLRVKIDENLAGRNLAFVSRQIGASEIYVDGARIVEFGKITDSSVSEYNPNRLPIPFQIETAGEHVVAVRLASDSLADTSGAAARWMAKGGLYPEIYLTVRAADDLNDVIRSYANGASMRIGFLFIGVLSALALLHFLLYLFYPLERANLFYSIYAAAFALLLVCGNLAVFGHQQPLTSAIIIVVRTLMLAAMFVALLAFVHVAFNRKLGKLFWSLTVLWAICVVLHAVLLGSVGALAILINVAVGLSFTFSIWLLVVALREKRAGAWILMIGVQILALAMFGTLINQFSSLSLPRNFLFISELALILSLPLTVSIFLARNFARTNRNLNAQLAQVEELSRQKIEQERHAAELRAENERRAKELEEARQLQISMLPKRLPQIANLEIAVYMKPATEVGGDYYDFHVSPDGTLTVAVGDATGHGLKAGTVVTAAKALFANLAHEPDITDIFRQSSAALKKINLRGLFMAMTILKFKDKQVIVSSAGMPSILIFRDETKQVEEISIKAMPLGSIANFPYREQQFDLSAGDCIVVMSDGFPEMFNERDEILGFDKAAEVLPGVAHESAQEIINRLVETAEHWAGTRAQDDDVTFVVLKMKEIVR